MKDKISRICPICGSHRVTIEETDNYVYHVEGHKTAQKVRYLTCIDCYHIWTDNINKIDISKDKEEHEKFNELGRMTEAEKTDLKIDLELFGKENKTKENK